MDPPPETAATPRRLTVADLLRLRRPTTGASSLLSSSPSASTAPPPKKPKLHSPNRASSPRAAVFAPISHPVLLAGTLSLPSAAAPAACRNHCFSFSDGSQSPAADASVCCHLLDFDPAALGREIHVLAWNYLPSARHHGAGVLEVVRWLLTEPPALGPPPRPRFLTTIPLNGGDVEPDLTTRGRVFGVVRSVSVVFSVPHAAQKSKPDESGNTVGFLVEIVCCGCHQCRRSPPDADGDHKFEVERFVYFVDLVSRWRPVLARLIGRLVYVSGLKKKMVSIGEKNSYTVLVSLTETLIAWCPSFAGVMPLEELPGKCSGVYGGVVTGIYMQGMVVELDESTWLLIDDQQLAPPHSLRVGAVISVKNFRVIHLNFAWTRIVLLGTCSKTSINVNSFSLVDSKMLLLISCFKQKFTKSLSDKEILGSKNKQGLVHTYATKVLSSKDCQRQHNFIMKFCNHNCGISRTESNLKAYKLVVPFSNFICSSESLWISMMLKVLNGAEVVGKNQGLNQFLCDGVSYPGTTKRMISSDKLGLVLVGSIKTSSLSGRLQLVDATGCIDVFIPDLQRNVCTDDIFEISDYTLALEGPLAYLDHYAVADPLSCKAAFQQLFYRKRVHHLRIYVIIYWSELNRIGPFSHIPLPINNRARLFHLLKLLHIFPTNNTFQYQYQNMPGPSLYAEAVIGLYDLKFIGEAECIDHAESFRMSCTRSTSDSKVSMAKPCYIACSLSFGATNVCGTLVSSYSCGPDGTIISDTISGERDHTSKVLLEFKEGSHIKYQLLRIGAYYLLECPSESFTMKGCGCVNGGKILLDSQDKLWSFAITFNDSMYIKGAIQDQSSVVSSLKVDEPFSRNTIHNEIKLAQSWTDFHQYSDFHLNFCCESTSEKMEEYGIMCHVLNRMCSYSNEIICVSSCIEIMTPKKPCDSSNLLSEQIVQGDLISLQGKIKNIHSYERQEVRFMPGNEKYNICIHVADDNHTVRLCGHLSKHCYPVGLGPGARVTFHRVLLTKHELLLTPVTYIEVTSISYADLNDESVASPPMSDCLKGRPQSRVSPCLLLPEKQFSECKPLQFHCRVVTILKLVLNSFVINLQISESINQRKALKIKVPLAGFIVDDGSTLLCCWADDARAELLLRLQEVAVLDAYVNLKFPKDGTTANLQHTVGSCLEKMLKKHRKVIVKNHGNPPDISCRDLEVSSGMSKVLSGLEEKLMKFIILNACWKGSLNVTASVVHPISVNGNVELPDLYPTQNLQNFWVNEAFQVDPLEETWKLCDNLVSS